MALIDRVKNILLTPKAEWPVIAGETTTTADLLKNYAGPLVVLSAICGFIGSVFIGYGGFGLTFKVGIVPGIVTLILSVVMGLIGVVIIGYIIDALAPTFGGQKNLIQATKVGAYALTAVWLGGVFQLIPMLGALGILASLYSIYLLYLGLPVLMKCPEDKAIGYTAVAVIASFVVMAIMGMVTAAVGGFGGAGLGKIGSLEGAGRGNSVTIEKGSAAAKLEAFGKNMEEASKKIDVAQKSGNQAEAAAAAVAGLSAAFGGGKAAEALSIEQLKPLLPETLAGLPKKSSSAEKTGAVGFMISEAKAQYNDDAGKRIDLKIADSGGAAGFLALAGWAMVQGEKEDANGSEKTQKMNGRMVHQKVSKTGGRNEYSVVVAERFVVTAKGTPDIGALASAVNGLDLAKLESMKDIGVQK